MGPLKLLKLRSLQENKIFILSKIYKLQKMEFNSLNKIYILFCRTIIFGQNLILQMQFLAAIKPSAQSLVVNITLFSH